MLQEDTERKSSKEGITTATEIKYLCSYETKVITTGENPGVKTAT